MRDKLFGHDYWAKQTGKRKSLYALDRDFHAKMDAYYAARYDATKAPSFWDDFPEVYERCCELLRAEAKKAATLETLHVSMRANLHRRMIAALENLTASDRSTPTHEMILDLRAKNLRESARKLAEARARARRRPRLPVSPPKTRVIAVR
ncbi:hypothetical protein JL722_4484 [Aureococcus anophagefferens]|nr:hypothetical protein JL722_4484 [Aureococcus anophagefferens]